VTVREALLEAASRAAAVLGDSAALVADYLRGQLAPEGGFRGRGGPPDLYYTAFGLQASQALGALPPLARAMPFLESFGHGERLDLVHLASLARCLASLGPEAASEERRAALAARLEDLACPTGGFSHKQGSPVPSVYGCFLALGAYEDLGLEPPSDLADHVESLKRPDGSYANEPSAPRGSTPATVAAVVVRKQLGRDVDAASLDWLMSRFRPGGGFVAAPGAPVPDLLSTATALHALAVGGRGLEEVAAACLDFVETLWDGHGAFRGSWLDPTPDPEYTFYGLLALGHLCGCDE